MEGSEDTQVTQEIPKTCVLQKSSEDVCRLVTARCQHHEATDSGNVLDEGPIQQGVFCVGARPFVAGKLSGGVSVLL